MPVIATNQHASTSTAIIQQAPIQTTTLTIPQVVTNPLIEVVNTRVENGLVIEQTADGEEWSYDPNEPRYCICNQVSYGDMVACDNETVSFPRLCAHSDQLYYIILISNSAHWNGSITLVLGLLNRRKENGTVQSVLSR